MDSLCVKGRNLLVHFRSHLLFLILLKKGKATLNGRQPEIWSYEAREDRQKNEQQLVCFFTINMTRLGHSGGVSYGH